MESLQKHILLGFCLLILAGKRASTSPVNYNHPKPDICPTDHRICEQLSDALTTMENTVEKVKDGGQLTAEEQKNLLKSVITFTTILEEMKNHPSAKDIIDFDALLLRFLRHKQMVKDLKYQNMESSEQVLQRLKDKLGELEEEEDDDDHGSNTTAIVFGVLGGICGVAFIAYLFIRYRRS